MKNPTEAVILDLIRSRLTNSPELFEHGFALLKDNQIQIRFEKLKQAIREVLKITPNELKDFLASMKILTKKDKRFVVCYLPAHLLTK